VQLGLDFTPASIRLTELLQSKARQLHVTRAPVFSRVEDDDATSLEERKIARQGRRVEIDYLREAAHRGAALMAQNA